MYHKSRSDIQKYNDWREMIREVTDKLGIDNMNFSASYAYEFYAEETKFLGYSAVVVLAQGCSHNIDLKDTPHRLCSGSLEVYFTDTARGSADRVELAIAYETDFSGIEAYIEKVKELVDAGLEKVEAQDAATAWLGTEAKHRFNEWWKARLAEFRQVYS